MTPAFLAAAAALLLATLALLLRPYLLRRKRGAAASQRRINIAIYRDQLDELERDRAGGALGRILLVRGKAPRAADVALAVPRLFLLLLLVALHGPSLPGTILVLAATSWMTAARCGRRLPFPGKPPRSPASLSSGSLCSRTWRAGYWPELPGS